MTPDQINARLSEIIAEIDSLQEIVKADTTFSDNFKWRLLQAIKYLNQAKGLL